MIKGLKIPLLIVFGFMIILVGCTKNQQEVEKPVVRLNSFSMNVNGQFWEPSIIGGDSCYSRFSCQMSALSNLPYYTIIAHKDTLGVPDFKSEDYFRLQIMNVQEPGVYAINDAHGDFASYARFINYEADGNRIIYDTRKDNKSSKVTIDELLPIKGFTFVGIKGSFTGTVYNIENPNDSMVITDCKFIFNRINWGDFLQCEQ